MSNKPRILLLGSTGTIGSAVKAALAAQGAEVLCAGRNQKIKVDLADEKSIVAMYKEVGMVDHGNFSMHHGRLLHDTTSSNTNALC